MQPTAAGAGQLANARWRRAERIAAWTLLAAGLLLRIVYALHYRMDSDEPQHLHVAWGWVNGFLQYRDLFDNHMPLFHMLSAPLVAIFGERADLLILMRLAMLPLYAAAMACVYWIGRTLWGPRVGLWAAVWTALLRPLFLLSVEYRADDLWMVFWLLGIALLVRSKLRPSRTFLAGLSLGAALGVSIKTGPLLVALVAAGFVTMLITGRQFPWRQYTGRLLRAAAAGLVGLLIIPAGIVLYFAASGAWEAFVYANFKHNMTSGFGNPLELWFLVVLPVVIGAPIVWTLVRIRPLGELTVRRILFVLLTMTNLALLAFWPIVTGQNYLVMYPLVGLVLVAALDHLLTTPPARLSVMNRWLGTAAGPLAAVGLVVGIVELGILLGKVPAKNEMTEPVRVWQDVLRLTDPGQFVMDLKGELLFRPRAWYYVLETMTVQRLRQDLLREDVVERLVATKTCVVSAAKYPLPERIDTFFEDNYVCVGRLLVAGKFLNAGRTTSGPLAFDINIAARYGIITASGVAQGALDGQPYDGPRDLPAGRHTYEPAPAEREVVLLWAQALERGFRPVAGQAMPVDRQ